MRCTAGENYCMALSRAEAEQDSIKIMELRASALRVLEWGIEISYSGSSSKLSEMDADNGCLM